MLRIAEGRFVEAEQAARRAVAAYGKVIDARSTRDACLRATLTWALLEQKRYAEAIEAEALMNLERYAEAEALLIKARRTLENGDGWRERKSRREVEDRLRLLANARAAA